MGEVLSVSRETLRASLFHVKHVLKRLIYALIYALGNFE